MIDNEGIALTGISVSASDTVSVSLIRTKLLTLPSSILVLLAHLCARHAVLFGSIAYSCHLALFIAVDCFLQVSLARLQILDHGACSLWALEEIPGYRCLLKSMVLSILRAQEILVHLLVLHILLAI